MDTSPPNQPNRERPPADAPPHDAHLELYVAGDQIAGDKVLGDKVLGNKTTYVAHDRHDVRSLRDHNPYLGLHRYTYERRDSYAGRDAAIREARIAVTTPSKERVLYFIT